MMDELVVKPPEKKKEKTKPLLTLVYFLFHNRLFIGFFIFFVVVIAVPVWFLVNTILTSDISGLVNWIKDNPIVFFFLALAIIGGLSLIGGSEW